MTNGENENESDENASENDPDLKEMEGGRDRRSING